MPTSAENLATWPDIDRRQGPADRRTALEDRRNEDRVADDPLPRRNPEVSDRRRNDKGALNTGTEANAEPRAEPKKSDS